MVALRLPLLIVAWLAALLGAAPLWPWLAPELRILLPAALVLSVIFDTRDRYPLPPRLATALALLGFFWYAAQLSRADLVAPVVNILAVLLALRLVTEKSVRNLLQLFVLALLTLAASSLYSLSGAFLLFLILEIICVAFGLVLLCFVGEVPQAALERKAFRKLLTVGLVLPLVSLVLMPPLFFIMPRTQMPLWNFLNQPETAVSGITDRIEPGTISSLAASHRITLRVEGEALPPTELYWRTMVLNAPEGKAWVRKEPPAGEMDLPVGQRIVTQVVYTEPRNDHFLSALDAPFDFSGIRGTRSPDGLLVAQRTLDQRTRVQITSRIGGTLRVARPFDPAFYLVAPPQLSPRLRAIAASIEKAAPSAKMRLDLAERFFLAQGLDYSQSSLPGGADPLDDFLFVKKSGYCEHFATAFTVVLRLSGVPARLVGGYYGGEYNALGGYYLISEDRAHVWVEALIDGRWERFDPTRLARNAELVGGQSTSHLRGLSQWLDAASYYWNRTVINYDLAQQLDWLHKTGEKSRQWRVEFNFRAWLPKLLWTVGIIGVAGLVLRYLSRSREERLLRRFLRMLRSYGIETGDASLGLRDLAERCPHPAAREFAAAYNAVIFSEQRLSRVEAKRLQELIRRCKVGRLRR